MPDFETWGEFPIFTATNSGNGTSVNFTITNPSASGWQYSRIWGSTNIATGMSLLATNITSTSFTVTGLSPFNYYTFTMDSVGSGLSNLEDSQYGTCKKVYVTSTGGNAGMQFLRLCDLSMVYWLRDNFSASNMSDYVTVLDGFPEDLRVLVPYGEYSNEPTQRRMPVVSVEALTMSRSPMELGSRDSLSSLSFNIDIFAENDGQRDDIQYLCVKFLNGQTIPIYNYNEGFPPVVIDQTVTGYMFTTSIRGVNSSLKNSLVPAERHSYTLFVSVDVSEIFD